MRFILSLLIFLITIPSISNKCSHPIFCSQSILEAVSRSNYFSDSKTFVDLILKVPIEIALVNFNTKSVQDFIMDSFYDDPNKIL